MVLGWRRAFCTSIPREQDSTSNLDCLEDNISNLNPTPKIGTRFGFFTTTTTTTSSSSNPSTPRLRSSHSVSTSPALVCRTTATVSASVPVSPKLHCETKNSPRGFFLRSSNPSSPRSPSPFSFLKSTLRLNTRRCGLCLQSVKKGQGMATFTAECCHTFHFPCVSDYVKKQGSLACPVCSSLWKEMPQLSIDDHRKHKFVEEEEEEEEENTRKVKLDTKCIDGVVVGKHLLLKVYNDDESLVSLTPKARFNPIPESDENCDEDSVCEFQGFNVTNSQTESDSSHVVNEVEVRLLPEAAVVANSRRHETYVIVMKVKAPPAPEKTRHGRAPVDLVTVVDVSSKMSVEKLEVVKKAMRLIISSLSSSDRLSIVAFSTYSKRLLPLRRMTPNGRRAARRIVEAMAVLEGSSNPKDAVKKGVKVLEDRKEKNPIANIILLSEVVDQSRNSEPERFVASTRYPWPNISIHSLKLVIDGDHTLAKLIGNLLNVMVHGVELELRFSSPGVIAAVYSRTPQLTLLGSSTVKIGDMFGDEEKELYIEVKGSLSSSVVRSHQELSVRCRYRESCTHESIYGKQQTLLVPRPQTVRSSSPSIQRLRNLFISTRALAESRRLAERADLIGAYHMLVSARVLMLQSKPANDDEFVLGLEAELSELQRRRKAQGQVGRRGKVEAAAPAAYTDEKGEPLTPTSAWRVADKLAKVAMMRKSVNRVSDLHGFEDARF